MQAKEPAFRLLGQPGLIGVDWSSDGQLLATGGSDGTARIWDATTGEQLLVLAGHAGGVATVAFNPDGTRLLTGGGDDTARVWDITGAATAEVFGSVEPSGLSSVSYSADGTRLLTSDWAGRAWLWDTRGDERVRGFNHACCDAVFGPGGLTIATLFDSAAIVSTSSGEVIKEMSTPAPGNGDNKLAFSPDGSLIATAQYFGKAALYDASTGALLKNLGEPTAALDHMRDVDFGPNGDMLAGISGLATLYLWNVPSGSEMFHLQAQTGLATAVVLSDGDPPGL